MRLTFPQFKETEMSRKMEKLFIVVGCLVIAMMAAISISMWIDVFERDRASYTKATECVAKKVALGIERKDIKIKGDTCYVK